MTQEAIDILNRWIAEAVHVVPPEEIAKEAARLAVEFTAYAKDAGLNIENLETDISQELPTFMAEALEGAAAAASGTSVGPITDPTA